MRACLRAVHSARARVCVYAIRVRGPEFLAKRGGGCGVGGGDEHVVRLDDVDRAFCWKSSDT